MPTIISGSTGISGTDGTAATPAVQGTDTNTGIFFPAADTIAFAEGGTEVMRIDSAGNVGIGTVSPGDPLVVERSLPGGNGPFIRFRNSAGPNVTTFGPGLILDNGKAGVSPLILTQDQSTNAFRLAQFNSPFTNFMSVLTTGDFQFNSGYGSVATAFGCRAWVNFNGTGTVAIRASGNVSSITDRAVGQYTVNFITPMPDANYVCAGYANQNASIFTYGDYGWGFFTKATSSFNFDSYLFASGISIDAAICDVAVFR